MTGRTRSWWGWGSVEDAVRGRELTELLCRVATLPTARMYHILITTSHERSTEMAMMGKLKGMLGKNSDKATQAVDKASSYADQKTGGKYSDKINKGTEKARNYIDGQGQQGEGGQGGQGDGGQQQQ